MGGTVVAMVTVGAVAEIQCGGDCDMESAPDLEDAISHAVRRGFRLLLIDLSEATYLDSGGIRALLRARGEAEALAGRVALVGVQRQPRRALDLGGLGQVLFCAQSREEAVAYLTSGLTR